MYLRNLWEARVGQGWAVGPEWILTFSALIVRLKIKQEELREGHSFVGEVAFELALDSQAILLHVELCCLVGRAKRAQSWAVLANPEAHTWLARVAVRRGNVGQEPRG